MAKRSIGPAFGSYARLVNLLQIANRMFLCLDRENPLFHPQCTASDLANSMLIGRAFCRLLAVGRLQL